MLIVYAWRLAALLHFGDVENIGSLAKTEMASAKRNWNALRVVVHRGASDFVRDRAIHAPQGLRNSTILVPVPDTTIWGLHQSLAIAAPRTQ
jgi:hypothetical protein